MSKGVFEIVADKLGNILVLRGTFNLGDFKLVSGRSSGCSHCKGQSLSSCGLSCFQVNVLASSGPTQGRICSTGWSSGSKGVNASSICRRDCQIEGIKIQSELTDIWRQWCYRIGARRGACRSVSCWVAWICDVWNVLGHSRTTGRHTVTIIIIIIILSWSVRYRWSWKYLKVQQTPNPEAQFPSIDPDLSVHSVFVKQVPMSPDDFPVHMLKC